MKHMSTIALSSLFLAGCGAAPAPEVAPLVPVASATVDIPAPTASAIVETPPPLPPSPVSPFHLIANLDEQARVHVVGNRVFMTSKASKEQEDAGNTDSVALEITSSGMKPIVPAKPKTLGWGYINALSQSPKGDVFMAFSTDNGRVPRTDIFRAKAGKWVSERAPQEILCGMSTWKDGSTLALFARPSYFFAENPPVLELLGKSQSPGLKVAPGKGPCKTAELPASLGALPTGEVYVIGNRCVVRDDGQPIVGDTVLESWMPGDTKSVLTDVPASAGALVVDESIVLARSRTEVYLTLAPGPNKPAALVLYDGTTFTQVKVPDATGPLQVNLGGDGALFLSAGGKVWMRASGATDWTSLTLPDPTWNVSSVAAASVNEVYVTTTTGQVLSTVAALPLAQLAPAKLLAPSEDAQVVRPATKDCKSIFAVLFAFTKVTPPDYDFPLTRKAVKGKTSLSSARFVVTENKGRKFFGAIVPDLATGNALVDAVKKGVTGSAPALICSDPKVVSELPLDLATGERKYLDPSSYGATRY